MIKDVKVHYPHITAHIHSASFGLGIVVSKQIYKDAQSTWRILSLTLGFMTVTLYYAGRKWHSAKEKAKSVS